MTLFDRILAARGINEESMVAFLHPDYSCLHDPFLLPDMKKAIDRLLVAHKKQEKITIYGDYDIDGLTAVALLVDALKSFGFKHISTYIPNRFIEGYGLNVEAVDKIVDGGTQLILTVDCGSRSHKEITKANGSGVDVIVTDHHEVDDTMPPAVAVVNPKRPSHKYPFMNLAGVGVAFKLVQALQTKLNGLPEGQEKWLLDLVALGTVCDIVPLVDENRTFVHWGMKVMSKTKRPGLKALMAVARIEPETSISARSLGFGLGPRMNAAGRLDTAQHALDMLLSDDSMFAFEKAQFLDELNSARRVEQTKIFKEAIIQAEQYLEQPVLVVSGKTWNHGVVGIVASKLLEKYQKPVFIFQEMGVESKGSARSFGDFSAVAAIRSVEDIITKGGGHRLAAGVTLPTENIPFFRQRVNEFYKGQNLKNQSALLLPHEDTTAELHELTEEVICLINQLEPFGNGNPQPVLKSEKLLVENIRRMGDSAQHVKLELRNSAGLTIQFVAFNAPDYFFVELGISISVWYHPVMNEWRNRRTVEGYLLHLECD